MVMRRFATLLTVAVLTVATGCTDTLDPQPWQLSLPDASKPGRDTTDLAPGTGPRCGSRTDTSVVPDTGAGDGINCGCQNSCVEGRCQSDVAEVWKGKYTCTQGVTGITLTVEGSSDNLAAIYKFYSVPENPDVPTGKYRVVGEMDCNRHFEFRPDEWIDRPGPRWEMVGLEGTFNPDRDTISGNVLGGGNCERFTIERADR
ncbi:MAG: hypothetical protein ABEN55_07280 [Bradymonadaceae bacterium]